MWEFFSMIAPLYFVSRIALRILALARCQRLMPLVLAAYLEG
jgi:hypothetical protein